jgi:hypothetical protein
MDRIWGGGANVASYLILQHPTHHDSKQDLAGGPPQVKFSGVLVGVFIGRIRMHRMLYDKVGFGVRERVAASYLILGHPVHPDSTDKDITGGL